MITFLQLLLYGCPPAFRRSYAREILDVFAARHARVRGRPFRVLSLYSRTVLDISAIAAREWLDVVREHRVHRLQLPEGPSMSDRLLLDLRDARRRLAAAPGFTLAALAILALGIGGSATIFSAVDALAWRDRPFARPHELVNIYQDSDDGQPESNSYPAFVDITEYKELLAGAGAVMPEGSGTLLNESGDAEVVHVEFATASYFPVLGLHPALGRWFVPDEDRPGTAPAGVISHSAWMRRFGGDAAIVGRTVRMSGATVTIVGVAPPEHTGFVPGLATDFWLSIGSLGPVGGAFRERTLMRREDHWFQIVARLAPGKTKQEAQAAMNVLADRLARDFPETDRGRRITVMSAADVRVHPQIDAMLYPTAGVHVLFSGLLLAIVCSNLANLMLARGSTRTRELAVRRAIGATRIQIVRSLVVESLLLSFAGGLIGLGLAFWAIEALGSWEIPLPVPARTAIAMNVRVVVFGAGASLATGLAFGLLPAIRSSRAELTRSLNEGARAHRSTLRLADIRGVLVVVQVAISLALIACGGILLRSMANAMRLDLGFVPESVAVVTVDAAQSGGGAAQAIQAVTQLRERAASLPGVEAAALATRPPVSRYGPSNTLVLDEHAIHRTPSGTVNVAASGVTPGYFQLLRLPIIHGREFNEQDRSEGSPVAIVSETMARRFWGTSDVVGRRYRHEGSRDTWVTIVGVARDVPIVSPGEAPRPFLYRPFSQHGWGRAALLVSGGREPAALVAAVRQEVRAFDTLIPVLQSGTMQQLVGQSLTTTRTAMRLMVLLGGLATLLASVGIYSVVAFSVARRRGEMGVRMALGATAPQVVRMVLREMMTLVGAGLVAGFALAALLAPALRSLLIGVRPLDTATFVSVGVLVAVIALFTAWLPARRAAQANPAAVLRAE